MAGLISASGTGKLKRVLIGTYYPSANGAAMDIDVKSKIKNYNELSADNFVIDDVRVKLWSVDSNIHSMLFAVTKTYDPNTGIVSIMARKDNFNTVIGYNNFNLYVIS